MAPLFVAHDLEADGGQSAFLLAFRTPEAGAGLLMQGGLSLTVSGRDWNRLRSLLFTADGYENAAVLLCGESRVDEARRLLVREVIGVPAEGYIAREPLHLEVAPGFYNSIVDRCVRDRLVPVISHSHPFNGPARYSGSDDFGESRLLPILESLTSGKPASLLLTRTSISARQINDSGFEYFGSVKLLGPRVEVAYIEPIPGKHVAGDAVFDRQIRAFGREGQRVLGSLTVAVVGLGGTGALVAEQLARVGVGRLLLVDFDAVEPSNLNRLFGADQGSVGRPKVDVAGDHIASFRPDASLEKIGDSIVRQPILMRLREADIVIGCVDNDLARSALARFAHQYLVPVVDLGIRLDARKGHMTAAAGRVSVVGVDQVCLRCGNHVSAERIRADSLAPAERRALAREGYVMGVGDPVPAVATLNCVVAGLGATAAVNLFVNLTGGPQPPSQFYDATSGTVFTAVPAHESGCDICDEVAGVKGLGDSQVVSAYD
jgi:hypothetical protein